MGFSCLGQGFRFHATLPVFANWLGAFVVRANWITFGSLILYPDVRLHQYNKSLLELRVDDPEA